MLGIDSRQIELLVAVPTVLSLAVGLLTALLQAP
jgi:flagellar biosynthesis protein FliQ